MPSGRPTTFTEDLAAHICSEIAAGHSLRSICKRKDMPARSTVFEWVAANPTFQVQYSIAMENRAHAMAEEILEIADASGVDVSVSKDGQVTVSGEAINRARLRVDTRKWLMAKMNPKKYGDKVVQELTGKDGVPLNTGPTIIFTGAPEYSSAPKAVGGAPKPGN